MSKYSCLDRSREDFNATLFCQLLSQAIKLDLDVYTPSEKLLQELKADIDSLKLDPFSTDLRGDKYVDIGQCYIPLSVAMMSLYPFLEKVTERLGIDVSLDIEICDSATPELMMLKGETASDLIGMMALVESENRAIGGILTFEESVARSDVINELEKSRLINQSRTGRHLISVQSD